MTNEISTKLQSLIDKANTTFGMGMDIVLEAYNQAIADGHEPKQAAKILLTNVIAFKKSTIYSFLPDEAKNLTRPKKIPKLESKSSVVEVTTVKDGVNVIAEAAKVAAETVQPPEPPKTPFNDKPTDESDDGTEEYHGDAGNNPALIKKYVDDKPLKRKVLMPKKFLGTLFAIKTNFAGAADYDILLTVEGDKVTEVSNRPIMRVAQ